MSRHWHVSRRSMHGGSDTSTGALRADTQRDLSIPPLPSGSILASGSPFKLGNLSDPMRDVVTALGIGSLIVVGFAAAVFLFFFVDL